MSINDQRLTRRVEDDTATPTCRRQSQREAITRRSTSPGSRFHSSSVWSWRATPIGRHWPAWAPGFVTDPDSGRTMVDTAAVRDHHLPRTVGPRGTLATALSGQARDPAGRPGLCWASTASTTQPSTSLIRLGAVFHCRPVRRSPGCFSDRH